MDIKKFLIPEIPLPLNNTKIQEILIGNKKYFVSAGYSNYEPVLLVFDEELEYKIIKIPHQYLNGSFLETYQNKLLCGNNYLISVDILTEKYEVVSDDLEIRDGPWGGMVFENYAILGVSDKRDKIIVFDLQLKKIVAKLDPIENSYYIYQAIKTPDGKILIAGSIPKVSFMVVDPADWSFQSYYAEIAEKNTVNYNNVFLDNKTLYITSSYASFLFSYPEFKVISEIKWPEGLTLGVNQRQITTYKGNPLMWESGNSNFYIYDRALKEIKKVNSTQIDYRIADNGIAGFIEMPNQHIVGLKTNGVCFDVSPEGVVSILAEFKVLGKGNGWGLFMIESKNQNKLFGCSHCVQQLWEIDLIKNTSRHIGKSGPGGGQINAMAWDKNKEELFLASYSTCSLMKFKPGVDALPTLMVTLKHNQIRPLGMKLYQRELWMITLAKLGNRGGALSCYHIDKNELTYFMDILEEQSPQSILLDAEKEVLYLSLSIYPEGAEPIRSIAGIIHFDLKTKKVLQYFEPLPYAETIHFFSFMPNGNILMQDQKPLSTKANLYEYNPNNKKVKQLGESPTDLREVILTFDKKEMVGTSKVGIFKSSFDNESQIKYIVKTEQLTPRKKSMAKYLNISESGRLYGVLDENVFSIKI